MRDGRGDSGGECWDEGRWPCSDICILNWMLEGVQLVDRDFVYLYVNEAVAQHGRKEPEELLGRTMMECYPGIETTKVFESMVRSMDERVPGTMENRFVYPDGTEGWFELRFVPVPQGLLILSLDISDRKRTEAELVRATERLAAVERMELVGQLAGGLAHDFNGLLLGILNLGELTLSHAEDQAQVQHHTKGIIASAAQASALAKQLLTIGRGGLEERRPVLVSELVEELLPVLRGLVGSRCRLDLAVEDRELCVVCDRGQVERVLVNLIMNAHDAAPECGGVIDIRAYRESAAPSEHSPDRVVLAVRDNGVGMDEDTRARLFEPFFTTKDKGLGLGMATVRSLVRKNGGDIEVHSRPGAGTRMELRFPAAVECGGAEAPKPSEVDARTSQRRILLVEDNDILRKTTAQLLRHMGYQVATASSGEQALSLDAASLDLLLTDVSMPGMDGFQLAAACRERWPELQLLFVSGHLDDALKQRLAEFGQHHSFIQKPFTMRTLKEELETLFSA